MKMRLFFDQKELGDILKKYVEKKTGVLPYRVHADFGYIDVTNLQRWLEKGLFEKKSLTMWIPKVPTITYMTYSDLYCAINEVISVYGLKVNGVIKFGMCMDEYTFNEMSKGICCMGGSFNGKTVIEFETQPLKMRLEVSL